MIGPWSLLGRRYRAARSRAARRASQAGFSLIEVCLAILVIGFGLVSVFSLFPSGLRASEADTADTRCGLFTGVVLDGMRARAAELDWDEWDTDFEARAIKGILATGENLEVNKVVPVVFPKPTGTPAESDWLRYRLTVNTDDTNRYYAVLEVEDGHYPADRLMAPSVAYTEFTYTGH